MPNLALSPATRMSVAWRISVPPAIAGPSTAAISGLVSRRPLSRDSTTDRSGLPVRNVSPGCELVLAFRSAPAQKAPPAPVRTATRISGSLSTSSQAWRIRAIMGPLSALRASGRFIVTIRTWPRRSIRAWGGPVSAAGAGVAVMMTIISTLEPAIGLPETITRSSFVPMALNIADLFEHATDAFGDRIAVACGDRQVTYRELDQRTNQLAHYLASLGVGHNDHVGMYARNSIEAIETLLATYKLRARTVNINYRYVESELRYMVTDADLVALVYDGEFAPLVSAVLPDAPGIVGTVVIGDGASSDRQVPGVRYDAALAAASPERDFGPRSGDDIYLLYTGGTTGYPKGVLWRQEDVWRTLGGGIDFLTGEPLPDEWEQSKRGAQSGGLVKLCAAPLIHGSAQWTSLMSLFTGDTVVLLSTFDPHEIWRAVERHKVNMML